MEQAKLRIRFLIDSVFVQAPGPLNRVPRLILRRLVSWMTQMDGNVSHFTLETPKGGSAIALPN